MLVSTLRTKGSALTHYFSSRIASTHCVANLTHSLVRPRRTGIRALVATSRGALGRATQTTQNLRSARSDCTPFSSLRVAQRHFCRSAPRRAQNTASPHEPSGDATEAEADMGADAGDALPKAELYRLVATRLDVPTGSVRYVVEQTKNGVTVPFLARYRQDETGHMDEDVLRQVVDTTAEVKEVHRRRQFMLKSLDQRGLLTPVLRASLESMVHLSQLEDAWEPYKERKNTLAARGREAGLGQFSEPLLQGLLPVEGLQETVRKVEDGERLMVAILAEELQRNEALRQKLLVHCRQTGHARCSLVQKARKKEAKEMRDDDFANLRKKFAVYDNRVIYFTRMEAHSALALQRGESKGVLKVDLEAGNGAHTIFRTEIERDFQGVAARLRGRDNDNRNGRSAEPGLVLPSYEHRLMREAANSAYEHLLKAALNTVYRDVRKSAEKVSIHVFAHNLQQMLLQRPLSQSRLLAMDPGVRNGVKCVTLDANGALTSCFKCNFMEASLMQGMIVKAVQSAGVNKIVIGNGTASQETARVVSNTIRQHHLSGVEFAVVSEAGASVYSASDVAKEEFPTLDIMYRGAVSIGRRVLDPLSELVKIPVRSMGIGMYQHDVNEKELSKELERVLESCVARVGVNAASANRYVMEQVPGIQKKAVDQIVLARHAHSLNSREDLRRVPGMTESMFQQIAGFFRFPNSKEPLDTTSIHPESYELARKLLRLYDEKKLPSAAAASTAPEAAPARQSSEGEVGVVGSEGRRRAATGQALLAMSSPQLHDLATTLRCGVETLRLVAQELCQPGLDPRDSLPHAGLMRTTLKDKSELTPGEILTGVVMSVTTFGTFLDCGLHDSVLLRGRGVDRLQIGSLVQNLTFQSLDGLGRVQVAWDGVSGTGLLKEGLRQRLLLEMEDTLTRPSSTAAATHAPRTNDTGKRPRSPSPEHHHEHHPPLSSSSPSMPPRKQAAVERTPTSTASEAKLDADVDAAVAEIMKDFISPSSAPPPSASAGRADTSQLKAPRATGATRTSPPSSTKQTQNKKKAARKTGAVSPKAKASKPRKATGATQGKQAATDSKSSSTAGQPTSAEESIIFTF